MKKLSDKVGKNSVFQIVKDDANALVPVNCVINSWKNKFDFKAAESDKGGLRPAQLGAIFSIKAHWTVSNKPATIVMPTGTGKTETMIATVVSERIERTLIIVPSTLLRKQTVEKFLEFGVLQKIGVILSNAQKPAVAELKTTPASLAELIALIDKANVVVTTMSLLYRFSDEYIDVIAKECNALIVDEAHHIAANTWTAIKYKLREINCLQFTATPFRNDGKKIDGEIIYNFPLSKAQTQGYFKPINFKPIFEFDEAQGNLSIANAAVKQLEEDLKAGYNHLILVRAKDKSSADNLFSEIYCTNFSEYKPVIIHSGISKAEREAAINALNEGISKIVVCVDMFGEGIDIPGLKIAAIHDKYKSLPITLQFIGRFARANEDVGDATVITNIANDELNESLQELYAQDSDWNSMLNILSDQETNKEISLQKLAKNFDKNSVQGITIQQLRPKISMEAYKTNDSNWHPNAIYNLFDPDKCFVSINSEDKVIVIIEKENSEVDWTSFKGILNAVWNLHLVYWNSSKKIVYVNSTKKSVSKRIVDTLFSSATLVSGEQVFRSLLGVKRLMLGTIGLKSAVDGPVRFRMFAGIDIGNGISESQKGTSFKSNLFGVGYDGKGRVSIGCSYKGRIWSRWVESIKFWMDWCDKIASRILNDSIDTSKILDGALVPVVIKERPKSVPYGIEWPIDLDIINDDRYLISNGIKEFPVYELELRLTENSETETIKFCVRNEEFYEEYELKISNNSYEFIVSTPGNLIIKKSKNEYNMVEFFEKYPPVIKFVNQTLLEGNIQVDLKTDLKKINREHLVKWDWNEVNIRKESQGVSKEKGTIQYFLINQLKERHQYSVIFDDDGAGEIADVIAFVDDGKEIVIQFYHCKYSHGENPGARISDLYEVCGQAEKSVKWCQEPSAIIDRLIYREASRKSIGGTRFEIGDVRKLKEIKNKMKFFPTKIEITIVQPGVDKEALTKDMELIISGSAAYVMDTYGIELKVICS